MTADKEATSPVQVVGCLSESASKTQANNPKFLFLSPILPGACNLLPDWRKAFREVEKKSLRILLDREINRHVGNDDQHSHEIVDCAILLKDVLKEGGPEKNGR